MSAKVYGIVAGANGFAGVVATWSECQKLVKGVDADYRKFEAKTEEEAKAMAEAWVKSAGKCSSCGQVRILHQTGDADSSGLCWNCWQSAKAREKDQEKQAAEAQTETTEEQQKEEIAVTPTVANEAQARVRLRSLAVAMINHLKSNLPGSRHYDVVLEGVECRAFRFGDRTKTPKMTCELPPDLAQVAGGKYLEVVIKDKHHLVFITRGDAYYEPTHYRWVFDAVWSGRWATRDGVITVQTPIKWRKWEAKRLANA